MAKEGRVKAIVSYKTSRVITFSRIRERGFKGAYHYHSASVFLLTIEMGVVKHKKRCS